MNKTALCLFVLPALAVGTPAFCETASLEEMKQRCEEAREEKIAPLREAAIEDCASNRRSTRTREDCERLNSDFGQGGGTVSGGFRSGMFMDLPECVEYFDAQDNQRNSRSRR